MLLLVLCVCTDWESGLSLLLTGEWTRQSTELAYYSLKKKGGGTALRKLHIHEYGFIGV